jgi:hypothetical protein
MGCGNRGADEGDPGKAGFDGVGEKIRIGSLGGLKLKVEGRKLATLNFNTLNLFYSYNSG